jgi:FkbM family methyltransferase
MRSKRLINPVGRFLTVKKIAASILCHPIVGKILSLAFNNKIPHCGNRIEVPANGDPCLSASLFWGIYESAEIRYVRSFLNSNVDVIELGSSIGGVSSEIARNLVSGRRLICVEANSSLIDLLKRNLSYNAPNKECIVVHGAVSYDGRNEVEFSLGKNHLSSHLGSFGQFEYVPSLRLSSILSQYLVTDYSLVCDIEGAEVALFIFDPQALSACNTMIIELHKVEFQGMLYTTDMLIQLIETKTKLQLQSRYGSVCFFQRKLN